MIKSITWKRVREEEYINNQVIQRSREKKVNMYKSLNVLNHCIMDGYNFNFFTMKVLLRLHCVFDNKPLSKKETQQIRKMMLRSLSFVIVFVVPILQSKCLPDWFIVTSIHLDKPFFASLPHGLKEEWRHKAKSHAQWTT